MQKLSLSKAVSLILLFMSLLGTHGAYAAVDLAEGWEYRWGDSPFNRDGVPEWTQVDEPEQWQSIGFPSNPPGRNGREHVWFRIVLPGGEWQEPVLYIFSVDLIVQVWLDGERIYQYGTFDHQGRGQFEGWPWHAIPCPWGSRASSYISAFSRITLI